MSRFRLLIEGNAACFTRPEFRAERVSYEVPTVTAMVGVLSSIFWKPEIEWIVNSIRVLRPIQYMNITTNEVAAFVPKSGIVNAANNNIQRMTNFLHKVAYVVEADFRIIESRHNYASYNSQILRRMTKGGYWQPPYLGLREMMANYHLLAPDEAVDDTLDDRDRDLGYMLHGFEWKDGIPTPKMARTFLRDGLVEFEREMAA